MTRQSVREFSDDVRGRGRDEEKVGAIGQFDMSRPPVFLFIKEARRDGILRKSLKSQRRNEFNRVAASSRRKRRGLV